MQHIILFVAFIPSLVLAGKLTCGENEEFKQCGSSCPATCQNNNSTNVCPSACVSGCFCKEGYVKKTIHGPCVLLRDCENFSKCGENEEFKICAPNCAPTCENPVPGFCPYKCTPGCACKSGFIRETNDGKCVSKDSCKKEACKENEIYKDCGSLCPPTCYHPKGTCPKVCSKGCFCKDGYVLKDENQQCVKLENCPNRT